MRHDLERLTIVGIWDRCEPEAAPEGTDRRFVWRLADGVRDHLPMEMHLYYDRWRQLQQT